MDSHSLLFCCSKQETFGFCEVKISIMLIIVVVVVAAAAAAAAVVAVTLKV